MRHIEAFQLLDIFLAETLALVKLLLILSAGDPKEFLCLLRMLRLRIKEAKGS
jgi:hypothetical protein